MYALLPEEMKLVYSERLFPLIVRARKFEYLSLQLFRVRDGQGAIIEVPNLMDRIDLISALERKFESEGEYPVRRGYSYFRKVCIKEAEASFFHEKRWRAKRWKEMIDYGIIKR